MSSGIRRAFAGALLALVFAGSWLFRFNDPSGSFAGLTDDHFFYVVRGWQILSGDLPVRDFVDHSAPLYYYVAAAVQELFGRGTVSELAFSVTMLSIGAALTCWLATRAAGSLLLGLFAVLFHILLEPRFYNYPKVLVYAAGIPLIWWFADRPGRWPRRCLAAWTVIGFLFRHDHGVFLAITVAALLLSLRDVTWRERLRHAAAYAALVALLVAPYVLFIQVNGGLGRYLRDASTWAAKDRHRAPVVWPGLFDNPEGVSEALGVGAGVGHAVAVVRNNIVAWLYYLELVLPFLVLALISVSRDAFRPGWPRTVPKMIAVAILAIVLNVGFLRSPLGARLADPTVPHAVLIAWLGAAMIALLRSPAGLRPALQRYAVPIRIAFGAALIPVVFVLATALGSDLGRRLDKASLAEGPVRAVRRSAAIAHQLQEEWRLTHWINRHDRPDLMTLSLYLNACTGPGDRVFVQPYIPQVLAFARRAFAGGHADLRPGFFTSPETQLLTLERLEGQSVPVALLEMNDEYRNFRKSFPLIARHFDEQYVLGGTRVFDNRFGVQLFVRRDLVPTRRYQPLDWPCFR